MKRHCENRETQTDENAVYFECLYMEAIVYLYDVCEATDIKSVSVYCIYVECNVIRVVGHFASESHKIQKRTRDIKFLPFF